MNNTQLYLSVGIPSFLVILVWLSNRADIASLRAEMIALRRDVQQEMTATRRDLQQEIMAFRREMHQDFGAFRRETAQDLLALHERVAKVETRVETK